MSASRIPLHHHCDVLEPTYTDLLHSEGGSLPGEARDNQAFSVMYPGVVSIFVTETKRLALEASVVAPS